MTASGPSYKVKSVETVLKGSDVQARVFTLAPGEVIPWHYHRENTDHYFVLEGTLSISSREPDVMTRNFRVGSSHKIASGKPHLIANGGDTDCRFVVIQVSERTTGTQRTDHRCTARFAPGHELPMLRTIQGAHVLRMPS